MHKYLQNKKLYMSITIIVIVCNIGVFLSLWNGYILNYSSSIIPVAFLFLGISGSLYALYIANNLSIPLVEKTDPNPPQKTPEIKSQPDDSNDLRVDSFDLFRGLSKNSTGKTKAEKILINIARYYDIVQGLFYYTEKETGLYKVIAKYAFTGVKEPVSVVSGEGLVGQAIADRSIITLKKIPEDFPEIQSGLGKAYPKFIYFIPIEFKKEVIGLIEMSTFIPIDTDALNQLDFLLKNSGNKIHSFLIENNK